MSRLVYDPLPRPVLPRETHTHFRQNLCECGEPHRFYLSPTKYTGERPSNRFVCEGCLQSTLDQMTDSGIRVVTVLDEHDFTRNGPHRLYSAKHGFKPLPKEEEQTPAPLPDSQQQDYLEFLKAKAVIGEEDGFEVADSEINPLLKPHQRDIVRWAIRGGCRAIFAAFGLGKSPIQIEIVRLIHKRTGGRGLVVAPLGVRQEFKRDGLLDSDEWRRRAHELGLNHAEVVKEFGVEFRFVRTAAEMDPAHPFYLTNYESIRDGRLDVSLFTVVSLDEAAVLRSFGSKTFGEAVFGPLQRVRYRFVATATPSPNQYLELIAYAHFLGINDMGESKTRWFKRNSEKAKELTLLAHKEEEFWLWVATWAIFLQLPSDLNPEYSDDGYVLPPLVVRWHEVPVDHAAAAGTAFTKRGQSRLFREANNGVSDAAREKRESLDSRIAALVRIREAAPDEHFLIWHDLEDERRAIEKAIPGVVSVFGNQDLDEREQAVIAFSDGQIKDLAAKPVLAGSGCNFQRHCRRAVFIGIGFKFNDFIQAIHRIYRFLQPGTVEIDLIYAESERSVREALQKKWDRDTRMRERMREIVRQYGLSNAGIGEQLQRALGVERKEIQGENFTLVNNDCVLECRALASDSVGMVLTSIPFSTQYEYTPNYSDFGHTDSEDHFFQQMDFLTPELLRVLKPGRVLAVHVKDRVVPGGKTGLGFQTIYPFHAECIRHYMRHGFAFMGMKTIVTDVVRENNQTYRLGWTEQCKDGTKMGYGLPEYLLCFRKPPTETINSYADEPVVKSKEEYTRARWQIDADGFARSSGDRLLAPEELAQLPWKSVFRLFRAWIRGHVYDYEEHVRIGEALEARNALPRDFALIPAQSWHPDVWTDIARMRTLNGAQSAKGKVMHLCLARGSMVLTKERGYVPIQEVSIGDRVLTHKGRWRPVQVVSRTGIQRVVTLKAQGVPGLTLTPDHRLWTRKTDWVRERDGAERSEPRWIEAQDTKGAYVNLKLPEVEADQNLDLSLWWTVGRWLADGHIDARGCAIISCGPEKWAHFLTKIGRFGGNTPRVGTAIQVQLRDPGRTLRTILEKCGSGAGGKHIPPESFTLPYEQASALLDGYLSGDGYFLPGRCRWMASSISRELLLGLAFIVQRVHGSIASIHAGRCERDHVIDGRTVHASQEWVLSFDLPGRRSRPFVLDDGAWKKVRAIEDAGEAETWCLRVEEDESFTAEGCIVKNCPMQFDVVDRAIRQLSMPGELVLDPFSGIGTVPVRAVRLGRRAYGIELNTGYWLDSVAYCRAEESKLATGSLFDLLSEEPEDADIPEEAVA